MQKQMISCVMFLLLIQTAGAKEEIPHYRFIPVNAVNVRKAKVFKSFSSYMTYHAIWAVNGEDSANTFYRNTVLNFDDYFSGNLGVGTTSPNKSSNNTAVTINGTSNSALELATGDVLRGYLYHNSGAMVLSNYVAGSLQIRTHDINAIYIDADQRVAIGTAAPTAQFEVRKDQAAMTQMILNNANTTSASTRLSMYRGSTEMANLNVPGNGDDLYISNRTVNTDANIQFGLSDGTYGVTFRGNGSVGIGLSNPGALLEVRKDQAAMTQFILNNANTTSASTRFSMYRGSTEMANINVPGNGDDLVIANRTTNTDANIQFGLSDGSYGVTFRGNGNVGIGVASPAEKLCVDGNIVTRKLTVTQLPWSDYVFKKDYKLRSLYSLEKFITDNHHLPDVPSAKEVNAKGISIGDNQALLLKKIEELTLYIIAQDKRIKKLEAQIK